MLIIKQIKELKMGTIKFADLSCDFAILDRFNQTSGYELVDLENGKYAIMLK